MIWEAACWTARGFTAGAAQLRAGRAWGTSVAGSWAIALPGKIVKLRLAAVSKEIEDCCRAKKRFRPFLQAEGNIGIEEAKGAPLYRSSESQGPRPVVVNTSGKVPGRIVCLEIPVNFEQGN